MKLKNKNKKRFNKKIEDGNKKKNYLALLLNLTQRVNLETSRPNVLPSLILKLTSMRVTTM
jgi:hypothetical protein